MFCFQCEQAVKGKACAEIGVCGKQPDVAALEGNFGIRVRM